MSKEIGNYVEEENKYRAIKLLIDSVEAMPKHIKECKFSAPPMIPKEFLAVKIPSNMFFSSYEFSMADMVEHLKDLLEIYKKELPDDIVRNVKKESKR